MSERRIYTLDETSNGLTIPTLEMAGQAFAARDIDEFVIQSLAETDQVPDGLPLTTRLMAAVAQGILEVRHQVGETSVGKNLVMPLTAILERNLSSKNAADLNASLALMISQIEKTPVKSDRAKLAVQTADRAVFMGSGMHGNRHLGKVMEPEAIFLYAYGMAYRALGILKELKAEVQVRSLEPAVEEFPTTTAIIRRVFGRAKEATNLH